MIEVDSKKLQSAFNINVDQKSLANQTKKYMADIANSITTDTTPATNAFNKGLKKIANGMFDSIKGEFEEKDIDSIVSKYLNGKEAKKIMSELESKYVVPKSVYSKAYEGLLKGVLQVYVSAYSATSNIQSSLPDGIDLNNITVPQGADLSNMTLPQGAENMNLEDMQNMISQSTKNNENTKIKVENSIKETVTKSYMNSAAIQKTIDTMGKAMTEAKMKKTVLEKVGELTGKLTSSFATAFNVDEEKIASSFKMKMTEEEITRIVTAMLTETETNAKINLIKFGYQDKEEPTYISFYFRSFDGKERFKEFLNNYNEKVKAEGEEDKEINYTDTTGILMGSVKTIVNAVTYVLIAFISISLIVSSIMIGIITYISVYERTKEIGILRAIGASKHNISSIFNAETFIIGLLSGLFGIGITYAAVPVINKILHHFTGNIPLNATFYVQNAVTLVILSVILTLIGGLIPARAASKKDPVIALRTE